MPRDLPSWKSGNGSARFPNSRVPFRNNHNHAQSQSPSPQGTAAPSSEFLSFLADSPRSAKGGQKDDDASSLTPSHTPKVSRQEDYPGSPWDAPKSGFTRGADLGSLDINDGDELGNPEDSNYDSDDSIGDQFGVSTAGKGIDPGAVAPELPPVTDGEFYANLVFLSILRPVVGRRESRKRDIEYVESSDPATHTRELELQRDFLDRLCYLLDYKKGGDTITAAALEFVPQNKRPETKFRNSDAKTVKIWFAANNGIGEEAWNALLWIQELIKRSQAEADDTSEDRLAQEIGEHFITLASCRDQSDCCKKLLKNTRPGAHRINTYAKKMRIAGKEVRKSLASVQKPAGSGEGPHSTWIDALRNEADKFQLVQSCYSAWFDEPYSTFLRGAQHEKAPTAMRDFAHMVARLGAHRYAALKVAAGIKRLLCRKETRYLVEFDKLPRHSHAGVPLKSTVSLITGGSEDKFESDPWKVIHRLSQRYPQDREHLAAAYIAEEQRRGEGKAIYTFADEVRRWIKRRNGELVTRYHAELQVASWFLASGAFFFQNDPYVACSKGACWFCHQYLKLLQNKHGSKFVEPSRHNEIIPGVSFPPTTSDGAGKRVQLLKDQMNEVVLETIRGILLDELPEYSKHAQSTSAWMDEEEICSVARF